LPTLVIRIPNLETFLFCQHNSTGGGNLELTQTIAVFIGVPAAAVTILIIKSSNK
jgi:hypothetical protein